MSKNKLVLIVYYGRSGSAFIHSLLDCHPELICMPPVLTNFWGDLYKVKPDLTTAESAYDYFISYYGCVVGVFTGKPEQEYVKLKFKEFNCEIPLAINDKVFSLYFKMFFNCLQDKYSDPGKRLFICMHYAFDAALNEYSDILVAENKKIVFQLHNPIFKQIYWYSTIFGQAQLLQMIRSPLVTLRSILKCLLEYDSFKFTPAMLTKYLKQILFGATQFPYGNVDHFAVKLEDLHCFPRETLEKVAKRIDIQWSPSLLESTFCGESWVNVLNREQISGFSPESVEIDISDFFPHKDMEILAGLMAERYYAWDYSLPCPVLDILLIENKHFFLIEYLSFVNDFEKAKCLYDNQAPIIRTSEMSLFLTFSKHFSEKYVGKI